METFSTFKEFIRPELLVLAPVLYLIGAALKRASNVDDRKIPILLGVIGILLAGVWIAATSEFTTYRDVLLAVFGTITQGILCAGASVYVNQIIKQAKLPKEDGDA